jgi:hypothetical protein
MTDRRTRVVVAVAVVAGVAVAAVGLATRGSSKPPQVLQVDEVNGRVGNAVLGETEQNLVGALGRPRLVSRNGIYYRHLAVTVRSGRVASILTDDPAAQTEKVVRIGDPISAARASYRKAAKCVPNSPDKTAKHSYCRVKVPAGLLLIDGDPIKTMTLSRAG